MDTLFVLNKPIKNKLNYKFVNKKRKRVFHKPYTTRVTFAPNVVEQPSCENKVSFVRLYNELCSQKRLSKSKFCLDAVRNPVLNSSGESAVTQYNSSGDMKVYKQMYRAAPRTAAMATTEVMLEIDYAI